MNWPRAICFEVLARVRFVRSSALLRGGQAGKTLLRSSADQGHAGPVGGAGDRAGEVCRKRRNGNRGSKSPALHKGIFFPRDFDLVCFLVPRHTAGPPP